MTSKRACKKCKMFSEGVAICPNCGSNQFTESVKGKIHIFNPEESEMAKHMKITKKGAYAIKTR